MKTSLAFLPLLAIVAVGCGDSAGPGPVKSSAPPPSSRPPSADLGVPIYPGSSEFTVSGNDPKLPGVNSATSSNRSTPDSVEKVLAFYEGKLPGFTESKTGDSIVLTGKDAKGHNVAVSVTKDGTGAKIVIVNMG